MAMLVRVAKVIGPGADFELNLSIDDPPARATIRLLVDDEARAFGMKRGEHVLPPNTTQTVPIAGDALWAITHWGTAQTGATVTVNATENGGAARTGTDSGTVD